jgi:IS1 family transposase/transposase-like protein
MLNAVVSCSRVSDTGKCPHCKATAIVKNGSTKTGKQQYYCRSCGKRSIDYYTYKAYCPLINLQIVELTREGLGIRSTARVLKISPTTLIKKIIQIADNLKPPIISKRKTYEVDEMKTYWRKKSRGIWIVYALDRKTKQVVSFNVGGRSNKTLKVIVNTLMLSEARYIYTDRFPNYQYLIDKKKHKICFYGTNRIERKNLTLRTHLKRLQRRTICFSRSIKMLFACLKLYFFSTPTVYPV